jgi:PPIC-type PPIASE domain
VLLEPAVDRWLTRALALAVIGLVAVLAYKSAPARKPIVVTEDGGHDGGALTGALVLAGDASIAALDGSLLLADLPELEPVSDGGPSVLPSGAPRTVHLGVVLVTFQGAQGAPATARPKPEARDIADRLSADAKTDFHGAVQRGDNGSSDDIGRVPRGVLEGATEFVVFSLTPGSVSEVLETPRGFWIVKRID